MHFPTFLVAATALCATSASAKCFNTGHNWGDHPTAKAALADACTALSGHYSPDESSQQCRNNDAADESYAFRIENHSGKDYTVSQEECELEIGDQIDSCGHGGAVTIDGVYFRGDPNKGAC